MSITDWIGYFIAVAVYLLIGYWLHNVNKKPDDARIVALADERNTELKDLA